MRDTRIPANARGVLLALGVASVLYLNIVSRYGSTAGTAFLALLVLGTAAVLVWRTFSLRGRIRRSWPELTHALGLWQQDPIRRLDEAFAYRFPGIARIRRHEHGLDVWVGLLPGQTPAQFFDQVEGIAHTWHVHRVEAFTPDRGAVVLRVWRSDPLAEPLGALPIPGLPKGGDHGGSAPGDSGKEGHPPAGTADGCAGGPLAALPLPSPFADLARPSSAVAAARPDLAAVEIGVREDGSPWRLRVHGTHVLVAGVTGAGKGSVLWGVVRALLPAAAAGLVELWACDPKRMELSFGRCLFHRYASDPRGMVELLEAAAEQMSDRADAFAGVVRVHEASPECPFVLVIVDELAFLTAYQPDRDLRRRAEAAIATLTSQGRSVGFTVLGALQDPRKEVMNIRNLFPDRIALRLDEPTQVDMVLGNGARERGAYADLIPADPRTGAGVGYIKHETDPTPVRVRAAYVSDADIAAMTALYGRSDSLGGEAA